MASTTPVILIPPSEGKAAGGDGTPWRPGSMVVDLDAERARVLTALGAAGRTIGRSPTTPAIERYTGVLYNELAYGTLAARDRGRIDRQVITFSGLWGLVAPRDPIPYYKLKMAASAGKLGKLATWWRPYIGATLDPIVERRTVWDLLPQEHRAAWPHSDAPARRVRAVFLNEERSGRTARFTTVSHWNKLLKGSLVRYIVAHQATTLDALARFCHPGGYEYRPEMTEEDRGITTVAFVRPTGR